MFPCITMVHYRYRKVSLVYFYSHLGVMMSLTNFNVKGHLVVPLLGYQKALFIDHLVVFPKPIFDRAQKLHWFMRREAPILSGIKARKLAWLLSGWSFLPCAFVWLIPCFTRASINPLNHQDYKKQEMMSKMPNMSQQNSFVPECGLIMDKLLLFQIICHRFSLNLFNPA